MQSGDLSGDTRPGHVEAPDNALIMLPVPALTALKVGLGLRIG